ncbi:DUF3857 domain-containing protein [Chitinophaga solisilvae]|uniref:DUF3857 domain-containing protein n=1 Tax=Chitinophaga solisilvae TaxID=1233460 RepID=UPI00136FC5E8|nr:DUF3857 domain-containing protein [Chitinophaga solisilvae]
MKFLQLTVALILTAARIPVLAGDPVYPVSAIPDSLKKEAHLVKRLDERTLQVTSLKEMRMVSHIFITVLDEEGAAAAGMVERYDKQTEIKSISGALYDADGKLIKRLKQSDLRDVSQQGDGSLMTDSRYKIHRFYHNVYPYTVEYEVEVKLNNSFLFPRWTPRDEKHCTVQEARLTVNTPADFKFRYHTFCYPGQPVVREDKGQKSYSWEVRNLPVYKEEYYSLEGYKLTPTVWLAPDAFRLDDYEGNMNTWKGLSLFAYTLNAGRDELPDNIKQKVHQLTDNLPGNDAKIAALYKYLQQNYRYISIQLGIGGLQTFDARTTAAKGYGDCKALSNFMMAMLKEAGIPSSCAWVKSGEGQTDVQEDFPVDRFDHVILCIPGAKDTTWLECTSNTLPSGYLSGFTAGRQVLLLDEKGSGLVRTPVYGMASNQQHRTISATLDENGNMKADALTVRTGMEQDDLHEVLHALNKEKQLERMRSELDIASYDIVSYDCEETLSRNPSIAEHIVLNCKGYATVTGKRIFVTPNVLNRSIPKLTNDSARISPLRFRYEFLHSDTVKITIPDGYKLESLPAATELTTKFGSYSASTTLSGNTVTYIRRMERKAGTFPVAAYEDLVKFYSAINKSDRARLVMLKM